MEQIVQTTGGTTARPASAIFTSYAIDSRKVRQGALFFALRGAVTDGHLFVNAAAQAGATGAVVEQAVEAPSAFALIQVKDSLRALQALAASVRDASPAMFIGITGSAGKTTTKEFTAALLAQKYRIYKSEGNLNSITGLPLSLLSMQEPECAVFEVGMSEPGEMAALAALLQPDVRVLLNVSPVHLGQFPSVDAIADEKCMLLKGIGAEGVIVYNADDRRLLERVSAQPARRISFGFSSTSELRLESVRSLGVRGQEAGFWWNGAAHSFQTLLCGKGNLYNIGAAACTALVCGLDVEQVLAGIPRLKPYAQRGLLIPCSGFDLYDDSYNSNPVALQLALEIAAQSSGYRRKIAVLGDMLELGSGENEFHLEAGRTVAKLGFDVLITAGPRSRHLCDAARNAGMQEAHPAEDSNEAAAIAASRVQHGDLVLVKGSRGIKMENVVDALRRL